MVSPFPGVDPYIESQGLWEGFHAGFVTYCRDALNDLLPEPYLAELGEHLLLVDVGGEGDRVVVPDVLVGRPGEVESPFGPGRGQDRDGDARTRQDLAAHAKD